SDGDARRFGSRIRLFAGFEIPERSADVDHACDSTANIAREDVVEMRFDPRNFVFIRPNAVQIGTVRSSEEVTRLKEMNVRVDVAGQNEFAGAIDSRTPSFGPVEALRFPNSGDTISVDQDYRILNNLAVARIDQRPAGKRDFFSRSAAGER